jgi:Tol biopolymer transport system component/tRNA A-37 threonylcarbamoyl transferase component Bud32
VDIGSVLGHYEIVRRLGRGGMGEVYLARDATLGRQVALKVLRPDLADDADRNARFEREARAVAALSHPNIVTVHSIERADDVRFITMEYVPGKTLAALIPSGGLPLKAFLDYALPLVDAVSAAHQQGVAHRDLKPDNVMVDGDGRVKVLDFGLAKLLPQAVESGEQTTVEPIPGDTIEGRTFGTAAYMSPEQAQGKSVDYRSDIFSLGIMLHEMITGRRPFVGGNPTAVISAILKDSAPPIREHNATLPAGLERIVKRCLAKDPARRYQSGRDLWNDLDELKQELDSGALAGTPAPAVTSARALPLTLAGVAAVVLAAIGYWLWLGPGGDGAEPDRDVAFSQLTHGPGEELFPSLSPDGRTIVYASDAAGNFDIYAQRVGGENAINLTRESTADETQPAFAPDGERIAFRSERQGGGLWVMGATGESARRVADFGYHPAWSPDGQQLLCVTQSVTDPALRFSVSQLWVITIATGERRLLGEGDAAQPAWSPNGHRIAYWAKTPGAGPGVVFTIPATGGEPVAVTTDTSLNWNPVWAPDGRYLYFSSNRDGSMNVWRVALDERTGETTGRPEPVTSGVAASIQHLTISKDGSRIAYAARTETMNLQRVAFDPGAAAIRGVPESITRGSRAVAQPHVSPDGATLAFNSSGRQEDIFVIRADGSGQLQLTDDAARDRAARWSPDGQRVAFYSDSTGQLEIWAINRDASNLEQLTRSPGAHYPVWSPDGKWMAYSTHRPNGAFIFETGKPWDAQTPRPLPGIPDATQSFEVWSWSSDGRLLAGQKHLADLSHAGIGVHELGSPQIEWLTDFGEWPVFLKDGRRILFSFQGKLFVVDRTSRAVQEIMTLPQSSLGSVGLSPDEQAIYFTLMDAEADIWMMTAR